MTIQDAYVARQWPANKMRMWLTKVINIIMGGPDCDKSLFTEAIIRHLKLHHKTVEQIPDVAKPLVWQKDYEALKSPYPIAQHQFRMIELLDGQLRYPEDQGPDPGVVQAAQQRQCHAGARGQKNVHTGRFQDEEQAREVDRGMRAMLRREGIAFTPLKPEIDARIDSGIVPATHP